MKHCSNRQDGNVFWWVTIWIHMNMFSGLLGWWEDILPYIPCLLNQVGKYSYCQMARLISTQHIRLVLAPSLCYKCGDLMSCDGSILNNVPTVLACCWFFSFPIMTALLLQEIWIKPEWKNTVNENYRRSVWFIMELTLSWCANSTHFAMQDMKIGRIICTRNLTHVCITNRPCRNYSPTYPAKKTKKTWLISAQGSGWIDSDDTDLLLTDVWKGSPGRIVKK